MSIENGREVKEKDIFEGERVSSLFFMNTMIEKKRLTSSEWLIALAVTYTVITVTMNIFCMKALSFGTPVIICDGGLLISWGIFLISNVIIEVWGEEKSIKIINIAAIVSFVAMIIGRVIVFIPTLPEYKEQAEAFALVFSNGPRTIISSAMAFWCGNVINVHIIAKMKESIERKHSDNRLWFFFRATFSTLIGQLMDNAIFMTLAFAPVGLSLYEMAWKDILSSVLSGTLIELVVEASLVPFITIPLTGHIRKIKESEEK